MRRYTQAPLPFIGQKRNFIKHFEKVLNDNICNNGNGWTFIDVFGGSGLLAHVAKRTKPNVRVIYNDFDGYAERLQHIPEINQLRHKLADFLADKPRAKILQPDVRESVKQIIDNFKGYIELQVLSSWLLFSGQQVGSMDDFMKKSWYNTVRLTDYPEAENYLDGLEVRHQSYEQLLPEFIAQSKTLLILDPPYICTKQGAYRLKKYFGMVDFLRLMRFVRPPFVFFSSTRSEFIEYINWVISEKIDRWEQLNNYEKISIKTGINHQSSYEDNLIFKF
ncbi:DNA adenine methylase [Dichelobacter nodosus]|uniref:DNA adenine methylase n=1 Tax=Dichelobacter nodosus TaxID=870 RepID=UPI000AED49B3|nr:DNA adenine methylase [Dichelobacter nodosus]